jgi:hypothetical protein
MLKKIGLGFVVVLLVGVGFVWVTLLMPLQASADKNGPDTAARDYALQDDSKLTLPAPQAAIYPAAPNFSCTQRSTSRFMIAIGTAPLLSNNR